MMLSFEAKELQGKLETVDRRKQFVKDHISGLGYSLVAECLPSMCKALCSIPSTAKKKTKNETKKFSLPSKMYFYVK
jgi:hypothetical protein